MPAHHHAFSIKQFGTRKFPALMRCRQIIAVFPALPFAETMSKNTCWTHKTPRKQQPVQSSENWQSDKTAFFFFCVPLQFISIKIHLPDSPLSLSSLSRFLSVTWCVWLCECVCVWSKVPQLLATDLHMDSPVSSSRDRCETTILVLYSHMLTAAQLGMLEFTTSHWIARDHALPASPAPLSRSLRLSLYRSLLFLSLPLSLSLMERTAPSARLFFPPLSHHIYPLRHWLCRQYK